MNFQARDVTDIVDDKVLQRMLKRRVTMAFGLIYNYDISILAQGIAQNTEDCGIEIMTSGFQLIHAFPISN